MFELWLYRRALKKVNADYDRQVAKLRKANAPLEQFGRLRDETSLLRQQYEGDMERAQTECLLDEAYKYDIQIPDKLSDKLSDPERRIWTRPPQFPHYVLTPLGRNYVRKLVDEEKARRFEVKTLWVTRLILPLLAAIVGIIGALTGLIAVLRHKP